MPSRWLLGVAATGSGFVVAFASACGGGGSDQTPLIDTAPVGTSSGGNTGNDTGSSDDTSSDADGGDAGPSNRSCASGSTAQGCPCTTAGQTVACGQVHRVTGDYVSCSPGTQTCDVDMTWGACLGDRVGAP